MTNPWSTGNELYEHIKSEGIIINKDVWSSIYRHVSDSISTIILICQHCLVSQEAMSAQEAKKILTYAKDIKYAINPIIKTSKESLNFTQSQDSISLNLIIQQLIKHQFGHDIYAIELMLRNAIDPVSSLPIPLEIIQKIIGHAQAIKDSIEKFKEVIQQKEEKIYHSLYDSFKDGLILTDMKGNILDVNQAYRGMFGYSEEEIKKLTHQQLTSKKWNKREEEIIKNLVLKKDCSGEYEKEYIKKDGTVFPVSLKVWLIRNKQGEPLGVWGIIRDITERKNIERGILRDLLDSHLIINKISDGIAVFDAQGHFEVFNSRMQEITGYTIDEANQTEDFNILVCLKLEEQQEAFKELSKIVIEKGYHEIETAIQAKDGSKKMLLMWLSLIRYKNRNMFLSVWRDITEQRCLQDALRDSEVRFRRLFETAQDGILILDAYTGQIREVNRFLIDMLAYSREEFLGKKLWEMGAFIDTDKCKTAFQELQTKKYIRHEDLPLQTKDGRLIEVEFVSNLYEVDNTKVIQCNIRDITKRKKAEKGLTVANEKLKEMDKRKSAFVANVSHKFKNHLAVIKKSLRRIIDGHAGDTGSKQKNVLLNAKESAGRLIKLVTDLLAIPRIKAGKMGMHRENFDMVILVNEILVDYEKEMVKKDIFIKKDIQNDVSMIWGDRDKIIKVIINLLNNAIKYTPTGGEVGIKLIGKGDKLCFEISDTGPGIPEKHKDKIFDKLECITSENIEDTGLGLPIAKDIVELHMGRIWVENKPEKGSRFIFVLPRDFRKGDQSVQKN
ncbi:MAG: PAS domain S-box protein [Candidatus Omnitrophota bacterium]